MVIRIKIITIIFICYAKCEYFDLREEKYQFVPDSKNKCSVCWYISGKKCVWNGANGTCVNVHKCGKAKYDIERKEYPAMCAYDGTDPVVCCTDCSAGYSNSDLRKEIFNPYVGTLWKTGSVARDKFVDYLDKLDYPCKLHRKSTLAYRLDETQNCYYRFESSSGFSDEGITYLRIKELVHSVLLGYGRDLKSAQWLCGGTVISENYILTSANCTSSPEHGPARYIVMGILNDTSLPDPWKVYAVKRTIPHPEYEPSSKYHDIGLLETETPIAFSDQVLPISVLTDNHFWPTVIAWSKLRQGKELLDTLESVSVTSLKDYSDKDCSLLFPPQPTLKNGYNDTIQICFGGKGEEIDACEGDDGSSIFTKDSTTCTHALIGVTSIGRRCGQGESSALYTRVSYYVPWIESIVWPKSEVNESS